MTCKSWSARTFKINILYVEFNQIKVIIIRISYASLVFSLPCLHSAGEVQSRL